MLPMVWRRDLGEDREIEVKRPNDMSPELIITLLPSNRQTNFNTHYPL